MKKQYSVVLVEDHVIVRNGLKELIEHIGSFKVIGEFDHGQQLINKLPDITPDIIIMDLSMPVMDGLATTKWLKEHKIKIPVLMLTLDTSDNAIIELFKAGVRGYLPKTCTAETLKKAIEDIINTGYYHNELLANALMKNETRPQEELKQEALAGLTGKEYEFLQLVCDKEEYTYERIAEIMDVSRRGVDTQRENLFKKLNVKSKTGLVLYAIKHGLVEV